MKLFIEEDTNLILDNLKWSSRVDRTMCRSSSYGDAESNSKEKCHRVQSYTYVRRMDLDFEEDDSIYLKVSPIKGAIVFCKKEKFSPRYIEP